MASSSDKPLIERLKERLCGWAKMIRISPLLVASTVIVCAVAVVEVQGQTSSLANPEEATQAFFDAAHAFDFDAMRNGATSAFEMLYDGLRMTLDDFIGMLRGMERARDGRAIPTYQAVGPNTEVVGEVAYTTWPSPDGRWFESMILVRSQERWLVDRAFTMRTADPNP